jgi:hypothetical protein
MTCGPPEIECAPGREALATLTTPEGGAMSLPLLEK